MAKVAPPVPARKQSAAQRNITLRPLLPADSNAPIVYVHPAEGHVTAQTAFGAIPHSVTAAT